MVAAMRIDTTSLIAAQSAPRPTQAPPRSAQPADNPLFEPLIFREARTETAPAKPLAASPQTPPRRPGALVDITV
jgi:hypothetical protein